MEVIQKALNEALDAFDFGAPVVGAIRFGQGHINDTFVVHTQPENLCCRRFILQRMSPAAFKRPDQLMENIIGVTDYLGREIEKNGGDRSREALEVLRPKNGEPFFVDSEGGPWRLYPFVEHTICYQSAETPALFAASGRAFGRFQKLLRDYPADTLYETIPNFHNTEDRLAKLKAAVESDPLALDAMREGKLPLRVTHNDTKLNNVLMDDKTGEGVCIIDLDTVMPGLSINDFGDSIRFGANHCAEDETDLTKVNLDLELFDAYTRAFLSEAGDALTDEEIAFLPWGAKLMTLECGIRFLTDYLSGDVYFHITREKHNLDRCRTQCKLVITHTGRTPRVRFAVRQSARFPGGVQPK